MRQLCALVHSHRYFFPSPRAPFPRAQIIFEPSWNPAVDSQCAGRVWRLGQERQVVVTKLVATSTIDELIVQRQQAKKEISGVCGQPRKSQGALIRVGDSALTLNSRVSRARQARSEEGVG